MEHRVLEQFESLCAQDTPPACQCGCPVQVEAGTVARLLASGQADEARKILERHLPLAGLAAFLCEGPCRAKCLRKDLGGAVNLPFLERYAVSSGRPIKTFPLPATGKRVLILGSDLAALVCAFELAKKGHQPVIHHLGEAGASLASDPKLPGGSLPWALSELAKLKAVFVKLGSIEEAAKIASDAAFGLEAMGFLGAFFDLGDASILKAAPILARASPHPVTMASEIGKVFFFDGAAPRIAAISSGKKAAASLDRLLQGVDPASSREKELPVESRLVVSLKDVPAVFEAPPADPMAPRPAEATAEAGRCLACTCLACLPPCPFLRQRPGHPKKFAREFYNNIITAFGNRSSNRYINSCAECGLCGQICPTGADLGAFVDLCRQDMVDTNHMPVSTFEYPLEDQEFSNGSEAFFWGHQPGRSQGRRLFFPGCQLAASEPDKVLRLYRHLAGHLPDGIGLWSGCCGAPGRWSGRKGLTHETYKAIRGVWQEAGRPELVLACPSCELMFKREAPEIKTTSLWALLNTLPLPGSAKSLPESLVIHDPCAARLDEEGQDAVRAILRALGQESSEPERARRLTLCCGYGGLVDQSYPDLGREFAQMRAGEAFGQTILAWCVMCRDRFRGLGAKSLHPLDLLFSDRPLNPLSKPPGLSKRRQGRAYLKTKALESLWGRKAPEGKPMDLNIDIPASVLEEIEARRILFSDVALVLEQAAREGPTFVNSETGHSLKSHRPRQVTFWVEYERREDGSFLVHRAWCHRMVLPGVTGEGAESPASREGFARTGGRV
jgi:Fe-S oxidoreductase